MHLGASCIVSSLERLSILSLETGIIGTASAWLETIVLGRVLLNSLLKHGGQKGWVSWSKYWSKVKTLQHPTWLLAPPQVKLNNGKNEMGTINTRCRVCVRNWQINDQIWHLPWFMPLFVSVGQDFFGFEHIHLAFTTFACINADRIGNIRVNPNTLFRDFEYCSSGS